MSKIKFSILSILASIGIHIYLTLHYYPIKFATSDGEAACNLNATFNCDSVAASPFSSLFDIPLAIFGALTNIVLLIIVLMFALRLTEELKKTLRYAIHLSAFTALASIVMGAISVTQMTSYCLFCIAAYITSFATLFLLLGANKSPLMENLSSDIKDLFSGSKFILGLLIAIPAFSFMGHKAFLNNYGIDKLDKMIKISASEWSFNKEHKLNQEPILSLGPNRSEAKMIISEFADFLCGHCKNAAPTLHAFAKSRSDVRLEFYSFPLDGACNKVIERQSGIPCHLAKLTYCGTKQDKGWPIHDTIFNHQREFFNIGGIDKINSQLKEWLKSTTINWEQLFSCVDSEEAQETLLKMSQLGIDIGVKGTPTIFVNGKKLPRGQFLPVLQNAYENLK